MNRVELAAKLRLPSTLLGLRGRQQVYASGGYAIITGFVGRGIAVLCGPQGWQRAFSFYTQRRQDSHPIAENWPR